MEHEEVQLEEVKYDYNKHRDETTIKAVEEIWGVLGSHGAELAFKVETDLKEVEDVHDKISQEILAILARNTVPEADLQFLVESIQTNVQMIFKSIARQKLELEKELLARTIGTRDPGTNKFSREFATITDLFSSLEKIRNVQDVEENQYFIVKSKE
jgi:hypothetical protein